MSMRRRMQKIFSFALSLSMIAGILSGCGGTQGGFVLDSFAPLSELRTDGAQSEAEEILYEFIREDMMQGGGVFTDYLDTPEGSALSGAASGHEVLAESEGLLLKYAVWTDDRELYALVRSYITEVLEQDGYLSYRIGRDGTPFEVNAAVDDLRIIRCLYEGGDRELALRYAAMLRRTNLREGLLSDYYSASEKRNGSEMTLCYGDLVAMDYAAEENGVWQEVREKTEEIMLGGYLGDAFPFFQTRYQIRKKRYVTQDVSMVESLLTALHLAEVGRCPEQTIAWIEDKLENDAIYGSYSTLGEPLNEVQSTAIYGLCALIGFQTGNEFIEEEALLRMQTFQVLDEESAVYGAFADEESLTAHSFDNLIALLALRVSSAMKETGESGTGNEGAGSESESPGGGNGSAAGGLNGTSDGALTGAPAQADTLLLCEDTERALLSKVLLGLHKNFIYVSAEAYRGAGSLEAAYETAAGVRKEAEAAGHAVHSETGGAENAETAETASGNFGKEAAGTDTDFEALRYVVTTSEAAGKEALDAGIKTFSVGTETAPGLETVSIKTERERPVSLHLSELREAERVYERISYADIRAEAAPAPEEGTREAAERPEKISERPEETPETAAETSVQLPRTETEPSSSARPESFGVLELPFSETAPYAVLQNGCGFASYVSEGDLSAFALSEALSAFFRLPEREGRLYLLIDEIYPFTDRERLKAFCDMLYENGMPYILSLMPVYENMSYPEFTQYTDFLSYLQARGGTAVLHAPNGTFGGTAASTNAQTIASLGLDYGSEPAAGIPDSALSAKLIRARRGFENSGIALYPMSGSLLNLDISCLRTISSARKVFPKLPQDAVLRLAVPEDGAELAALEQLLSEKWLTVSDYRTEHAAPRPSYTAHAAADGFVYRGEEPALFEEFFAKSNRLLILVVGASILLFGLLLFGSRRIYKNKFLRKEQNDDDFR